MSESLDEKWTTRDRPVLVEVVRRFDAAEVRQPLPCADIASATGLPLEDVQRAARNFALAELVMVDQRNGRAVNFMNVSAEALRVAGLWPDAGDAFDRLIWSLEKRIAAAPPEEKRRLRKLMEAVVGVGRDLGVEVLGAAVTGRLPL